MVTDAASDPASRGVVGAESALTSAAGWDVQAAVRARGTPSSRNRLSNTITSVISKGYRHSIDKLPELRGEESKAALTVPSVA